MSAWLLSPPAARADPVTAETVTLSVTDGYDTKLGKRLSQDGKVYTVQASDDDYWETDAYHFTAFQFQATIPAQATIHSVRLFIQQHEEKEMKNDALSWQVGGGELQSPTVLASHTATAIPTATATPELTAISTPTMVDTATATATATDSPTAPPPPTASTTSTATPAATATPTDAPQPTATSTEQSEPAPPDDPTATATMTPENEQPPTPTTTPTFAVPHANINLTIAKNDFLFNDADGDDMISPGDILFYEIRIVNSGVGPAPALWLEDQPDVNSPLIPGSVQAVGGVVAVGNGASDGQVVVNIDPLSEDAIAMVSFRVRVQPADGVIYLQNQAWAHFLDQAGEPSGRPPLPSDDPANGHSQ